MLAWAVGADRLLGKSPAKMVVKRVTRPIVAWIAIKSIQKKVIRKASEADDASLLLSNEFPVMTLSNGTTEAMGKYASQSIEHR